MQLMQVAWLCRGKGHCGISSIGLMFKTCSSRNSPGPRGRSIPSMCPSYLWERASRHLKPKIHNHSGASDMSCPISCFAEKQLFGRLANLLVRFMCLDLGLERAEIIISRSLYFNHIPSLRTGYDIR